MLEGPAPRISCGPSSAGGGVALPKDRPSGCKARTSTSAMKGFLLTIVAKAGDTFQADVMRTIIDTVEFTIEKDGDNPLAEAREAALLHFGNAGVDNAEATVTDAVANLRLRVPGGDAFMHVAGSFG